MDVTTFYLVKHGIPDLLRTESHRTSEQDMPDPGHTDIGSQRAW